MLTRRAAIDRPSRTRSTVATRGMSGRPALDEVGVQRVRRLAVDRRRSRQQALRDQLAAEDPPESAGLIDHFEAVVAPSA